MFFENNNIRYLLFSILIYLIMFLSGYFIQKKKSKFLWIIPIISLGIYSGMRFGRGVDYSLYFDSFSSFADGSYPGVEIGWEFICNLFEKYFYLPWPTLVFVMSMTLMASGCFLLKQHKEVLKYALPLFTFYSLFAENLARWFLAFSFVLIAVGIFSKEYRYYKRTLLSFLFLIIAVSIHYGILLPLLIILVVFLFKRNKILLTPKVSLIIFLLLYAFFSPAILAKYTNIISLINIGGRFDLYQDNIGDWISNTEDYGLSITNAIIYLIFIVKGFKIAVSNPRLIPFYNIALIGSILSPAMLSLELSTRINYLFTFFQFLIFAYLFKSCIDNKSDRISCVLLLMLLVKQVFNTSFMREPQELLYIWDIAISKI